MAGVVGTCVFIPQQRVIIERIQGFTYAVVIFISDRVSRCSHGAVSVNFCVTTQGISNVLARVIELRAIYSIAAGRGNCTVCNVSNNAIGTTVFGAEFVRCRIPQQGITD